MTNAGAKSNGVVAKKTGQSDMSKIKSNGESKPAAPKKLVQLPAKVVEDDQEDSESDEDNDVEEEEEVEGDQDDGETKADEDDSNATFSSLVTIITFLKKPSSL
jgi:hypothetical protein